MNITACRNWRSGSTSANPPHTHLIKTNQIASVRILGMIRIKRVAVDEFIAANTVGGQ